jgi:hypothetical protein
MSGASRRAVATGIVLGLLCGAGPASASPGDPAGPGGTTVQGASGLPAYRATVSALSPGRRRAMTPSVWRPGCPVGLDALRLVRLRYVTFSGTAATGELVVHQAMADAVARVFGRLYRARFPIRRMTAIEHYGGSDSRSVEADNTSAMNCRAVTGGTTYSEHSYGRAIDVNPIENPYVYVDGTTSHRASRPYLDRSDVRPGMFVSGRVGVRAFAEIGWGWGGTWRAPVDLQHFSSTGH